MVFRIDQNVKAHEFPKEKDMQVCLICLVVLDHWWLVYIEILADAVFFFYSDLDLGAGTPKCIPSYYLLLGAVLPLFRFLMYLHYETQFYK